MRYKPIIIVYSANVSYF